MLTQAAHCYLLGGLLLLTLSIITLNTNENWKKENVRKVRFSKNSTSFLAPVGATISYYPLKLFSYQSIFGFAQ
jgi:hypothetical protein